MMAGPACIGCVEIELRARVPNEVGSVRETEMSRGLACELQLSYVRELNHLQTT
jgi:hypothetical protein